MLLHERLVTENLLSFFLGMISKTRVTFKQDKMIQQKL